MIQTILSMKHCTEPISDGYTDFELPEGVLTGFNDTAGNTNSQVVYLIDFKDGDRVVYFDLTHGQEVFDLSGSFIYKYNRLLPKGAVVVITQLNGD